MRYCGEKDYLQMKFEILRHVRLLQTNVGLFARQEGESKFCHFLLLGKQKARQCFFFEDQETFAKLGESGWFQDFRKVEPELSLIYSISFAEVDTIPKDFQLEIIDMISDHTLKELFRYISRILQNLIVIQIFCLWNFAMKLSSVLGSNFSCIKIIKSKNTSSQTEN